MPNMIDMYTKMYEQQQVLLNLYGKLAEAEAEIANGAQGEDFSKVAKQLRDSVQQYDKSGLGA